MDNQFVCIDPGENIGIAIFLNDLAAPIYTNVIKSRAKNWNVTFDTTLYQFEVELKRSYFNKCKKAYIEQPAFMSGSIKGMTAADSGSLVKLASIYGATVYILKRAGISVEEVSIMKWKGNMKKEMVNARIKRAINQEFPDHIADAVGIGLHLKGILSHG